MFYTILFTLTSVLIISAVSLISIVALGINEERLKKMLTYMVSFATGAILADAFIHLLPETVEEHGFTLYVSVYILIGMLSSFAIEKFIHWRHCHEPEHINRHVHSFVYMNLFGDGVHNFVDGLIVGASYLVSIPVGIATTAAVILHEIPQEIGDYGVLLHGGISRKKALWFNFLTALTAVIGAIIALLVGNVSQTMTEFLIPFAAGSFIYIAGADLIPELHKETNTRKSFIQLIILILGMLMIASLLLFE